MMEGQIQQQQMWWQKNKQLLALITFIILVLLGAFALAVHIFGWDWTGFGPYTSPPHSQNTDYRPAKNLWDYLELLSIFAIPVAVALGAAWFSVQQAKIGATLAAKDTARAIELNREGIQVQTFLKVIEDERTIGFSEKMKTIRQLSSGEDYQKHEKDILDVVNFLNYVAHLIRHRYVIPHHVLLIYTLSLDTCREKLIDKNSEAPGWLESLRNRSSEPRYFLHFETLCKPDTLSKLWNSKDKEIEWFGPNPPGTVLEELEYIYPPEPYFLTRSKRLFETATNEPVQSEQI